MKDAIEKEMKQFIRDNEQIPEFNLVTLGSVYTKQEHNYSTFTVSVPPLGSFSYSYLPGNCGMVVGYDIISTKNEYFSPLIEIMNYVLNMICSLAVYTVNENQNRLLKHLTEDNWQLIEESGTINRNSGNKIYILYKKFNLES